MDYEIRRGGRGQSLSWMCIELCNDGKMSCKGKVRGEKIEEKCKAVHEKTWTQIPKGKVNWILSEIYAVSRLMSCPELFQMHFICLGRCCHSAAVVSVPDYSLL